MPPLAAAKGPRARIQEVSDQDRQPADVGISANDPSVIRLATALLIAENDEWLVQRRYLSAESMT
jgi:3D (Asp-Asp-Asp) domain-containing protein